MRWRFVRRALRESTSVDLQFDVPVRASSHQFEPGVIGMLRPVLLLPRGLDERLTAEQMSAVLAHERCHVLWRDNIGAIIHMASEAAFWFHPLVWWLGARLVDERERACDEQVLAEGHAPESYAEGVLKVCEHYLESQLMCVAGVSGAQLKKRIQDIMRSDLIRRLTSLQKAMLAAAAALAVLVPLVTGILRSSPALAQAGIPPSSIPETEQVSETVPAQAVESPPQALAQAVVAAPVVRAQSTPADRSVSQRELVFWDSAPRTAHPQSGFIAVQPDGILIDNIPLYYLIAEAYGVTQSQLDGLNFDDSPVGLCCYNVKTKGATLAGDPHERFSSEPTVPDQYRPALQGFLAKEFGLDIKRSKMQVDGYVMTVGAGGAKLKPTGSRPPEIIRFCVPMCVLLNETSGFGVEVAGYTPGEFAAILSKAMGRLVVDETDLQGYFYFDAWLPRDGSPPRVVEASEIFAKMEEQLGLHVEARRVTADVIQIVSLKEPDSRN
jgi:uncharacterized protein (TIGR03435 family)